jgi:hypothetical protein
MAPPLIPKAWARLGGIFDEERMISVTERWGKGALGGATDKEASQPF